MPASNLDQTSIAGSSKVVLINVAYHQCLFALHATVVSLFSSDTGTINWSTARQFSAQIVFEHASATSDLITAVLSTSVDISTITHFVAWSSYSTCVILLTFSRSSNDNVKRRAMSHVQANARLIAKLAKFWRFAKLLVSFDCPCACMWNQYSWPLRSDIWATQWPTYEKH
jgi:hypothetical protein